MELSPPQLLWIDDIHHGRYDGTNATCDKLITYKFNLRKCEVKFNGASEPIRNSDIKPHSNPQPICP